MNGFTQIVGSLMTPGIWVSLRARGFLLGSSKFLVCPFPFAQLTLKQPKSKGKVADAAGELEDQQPFGGFFNHDVLRKTTWQVQHILYQHIKAQSSSNIGKVGTNGTEKLSDSHCYVKFASNTQNSIY